MFWNCRGKSVPVLVKKSKIDESSRPSYGNHWNPLIIQFLDYRRKRNEFPASNWPVSGRRNTIEATSMKPDCINISNIPWEPTVPASNLRDQLIDNRMITVMTLHNRMCLLWKCEWHFGTKSYLIDDNEILLNDKYIEIRIYVIVKDESRLFSIRLAGFTIWACWRTKEYKVHDPATPKPIVPFLYFGSLAIYEWLTY